MRRILSLLSVLFLTGIATLVSWAAIESRQPKHLGMALACWLGVVWYYRYQRRASSPDTQMQAHARTLFAVTPVAYAILVAAFVVPVLLLDWAGWLGRPNIIFLYFVMSGGLATVGLCILLAVRGIRRQPPPDGSGL